MMQYLILPVLVVCAALLSTGCAAHRPHEQPNNARELTMSKRPATGGIIDKQALADLERELVKIHGAKQRPRIRRGLKQVAALWRRGDGTPGAFGVFVKKHFIVDPGVLKSTAEHLEYAMEMVDGYANDVGRELSRFQVLDVGPVRPVDALLAAYSPTAHIQEDLFKNKIAFVALLNFPLTTVRERIDPGNAWTREQWALARLTSRFEHRVPPEVYQEIDRVSSTVESYIDNYNVYMDRIVTPAGVKPFRAGLKLISHWGLRDEIRGLYDQKDGLPQQRLIAAVMDRIIRQEIPEAVIDSAAPRWDPVKNQVCAGDGPFKKSAREKDARYRHLLEVFRANRKLDLHYPDAPDHMKRIFSLSREIPEKRMRELLESVLKADVARQVGALVRERLGRPLEAFDLWYTGFRPRSAVAEPELDRITRKRFPTAAALQRAIPGLLKKLGFSAAAAAFLGERIVVDDARGAGHAHGAKRRGGKAHLRTRVGPEGLSYKGFNIAVHELGHNVEQVFSMSRIDHTLLEGVPNTGFTEAFAFLFQARDLELLGKAVDDPKAAALRTLDRFWATFEIAGVAMLDIELWRWMYTHPRATPAELRAATVELSRKIWNRYFAPVFGVKDQILPAIYSHLIAYGLYTPDYPLGKLITFQIEQHMKGKDMGSEMERMCRLGRLSPDVWMKQAVGEELSSKPLLDATRSSLKQLRVAGR